GFDDSGKIKATILAIAASRSDIPNDPEVRFMETPSDMAPAIQTWWYPGNRIGHEFLYPKSQAMLLAKTNTHGVLAGEKTGAVTRVTTSGETSVTTKEEATAASASGRAQRGEVSNASASSVTENGLPDAAHPRTPFVP